MGDDAESHARTITVDSGTRLSALLEQASPGIRQAGWSWVAVADDRVVGVWSVDHGVQLLVDDDPVASDRGPRRVHFRYFVQIDPAWLYRRLSDGAKADLSALKIEYQPIAQAAWEQEQRRRERELPGRMISPECTAVLLFLGAQVDLHNDGLLRFDFLGRRWTVRRADTMTRIESGEIGPVASIRPVTFAECWLIAAVGAEARVSHGLSPLPEFQAFPAPKLKPMSSFRRGAPRWTTSGSLVAQLTGEEAVSYFRLAVGRSLAEIAELLTADLPQR